jgi:Ca-activated chloride channel family protein
MPDTALDVTGSCVPPSPTPTATSTATVTPSPTSTATSTATARPGRLFLPIAIRERCDKLARAVDAVLVIDASTSMLEGAGGGGTKLDAALAAARTFLDQLALAGKDQAAIVSFNASATVMQELTHDRGALESALSAITPATLTCLPCAVEAGEAALGSDPGSLRTRTMILLTDGRSNPRPVQEAVDRAREAKNRGVIIFTVGIGSELDVDALRDIASSPEYFFQSSDAADLERIYLEIDRLIPCAETFWPK